MNKLKYIKEVLGEPSFEAPGVLVYNGDCISFMERITIPLFDLTITSPPYNIGKEYEQKLDINKYLHWCELWIQSIHRLTSDNGAFWLNLGYFSLPDKAKAIPIPYLLWDRIPFYLQQEIVWNYAAGVASKKSFSPRNEKFLWYVKNQCEYIFNLDAIRDRNVKYPNQKKNGKLKCNPNGKNPTDVWQIPKVTSGTNRSSKERTSHPAQFPAALIERIIKGCSNPRDLIFDPFMGSGTVAETAILNGRQVVGFEIERRYIKIITERLLSSMKERRLQESQTNLFPVI